MRRREFLRAGSIAGAAIVTRINASHAGQSFRVPAEESPHELTFMQWPVNRSVHRERWFLSELQNTIASIANAIARFEPVVLLADKRFHNAIRKKVSGAVEVWDIATDDLWARDSGPLVAVTNSGKRVVSHIRFNGWGNKQVHRNDGLVAEQLAQRLGFELVSSGLTGEPGGVEQDGAGLLVAHESCWVNENRNPGLSRDEIEARLLAAYGAERMVWAPGLAGEDITDYHIDALARFTAPGRVLVNLPEFPDPADPFHRTGLDTRDRLLEAGLQVEVIREPNRRRVRSADFLAAYVNYYVCNGAVIAAQFGDEATDAEAGQALARHYPGREIVFLDADALGEVGGGIHCATQQLPAA